MDEKHHLTPRVLLRRFANAEERLRVYNRDGSGIFFSTVDKIAREGGFYDVDDDPEIDLLGSSDIVESFLGEVESAAGPAVARLVDSGVRMDDEDRVRILVFVALQVTRGWAFRSDFAEMIDSVGKSILRMGAENGGEEWIKRHGLPPNVSAKDVLEFMTSDRYNVRVNRNYVLKTMIEGAFVAVMPFLLTKRWRLYRFDSPVLVTSDEPVGYWVRPERRRLLPGAGVGNADVVWIALDPSHALGLADTYSDEAVREGSFIRERQINLATVAGARRFVMAHPDTDPLAGLKMPPLAAGRMETTRDSATGSLLLMRSGVGIAAIDASWEPGEPEVDPKR